MNPNNNTTLDPKLKEVYDRVMGTSVNSSTPAAKPPVTANPMPSNNQTPSPAPTTTTPPPQPATISGTPTPQSAVDYSALAAKYSTPAGSVSSSTNIPVSPLKPATVTPSTTTYGVVNNNENKTPALAEKKSGSGMKKILTILGVLIFFVIYTFVWVFVFGVQLPFLPTV